jgi:uncharacterized protein (TIGR02145 family)
MNAKIGFMKRINLVRVFTLAIMGFSILFVNSCKKDDNNTLSSVQVPVIETSAVSSITQTTAVCGGTITSDGGATVLARGVCWSTAQNPTITDSKTTDGTGAGIFSSHLTGLAGNTTYYMRSYATNSRGTGYGSPVSFTTVPITIADIDGNIYHLVIIGTQVWMVENLKTTKYRNGDPLPNITDSMIWNHYTIGAYCNYNNDANNSITYGRLYNWYAVNDTRNLAPVGYHVPSKAEWTTLTNYLEGESIAGGKLKESGITHWRSPNIGANNEYGFTALPAGYCGNSISFFTDLGSAGLWWSSTEEYLTEKAWLLDTYYKYNNVDKGFTYKSDGFSVRCLRD